MGSRYAVKTLLLFGAVFPWCVAVALAQTPGGYVPDTAWRPAAGVASGTTAPASPASLSPVFTPPAAAAGNPFLAPPQAVARRSLRVTVGSGTLPNEQGQVWREYDISQYTARVTTTKRPEQAIIDWILHETGYEVWHNEPLGVLMLHRGACEFIIPRRCRP